MNKRSDRRWPNSQPILVPARTACPLETSLARHCESRSSNFGLRLQHQSVPPFLYDCPLLKPFRFPSLHSVIGDELIDKCIRYSETLQQTRDSDDDEEVVISPITTTTSAFSSLGFRSDDQFSATSFTPDPHAVSQTEAQAYYSGLASEPRLVYRTGAPWSPPRGPEAQRRRKELHEVYNHPLVALWNDGLAWKVVDIMDAHGVSG
jgi:hypothetical protein